MTLHKILSDGTEVQLINGFHLVEIKEVGTDPLGFESYMKNTKKEIGGKYYAHAWEYEWYLNKLQEDNFQDSYTTMNTI